MVVADHVVRRARQDLHHRRHVPSPGTTTTTTVTEPATTAAEAAAETAETAIGVGNIPSEG